MSGSGFFKGEKKKPKKNDKKSGSMITSTAPVFTLPKMIEKKKNS